MRKGTLAGCCIEAHNHKPEELRLLARLASAWSRKRDYGERFFYPLFCGEAFSTPKWSPTMQDACTGPFRSAIVRLRLEISSGQGTLLLTPKSCSTGRKTAFGSAKRSEHTCPRSSNRKVTAARRSVKIFIGITCLPRWYIASLIHCVTQTTASVTGNLNSGLSLTAL
jgi:hypothetical protein